MIAEIGRLCFDVEVKEVGENNLKVLNNRIAINNGKDKTVFVDITAWKGTAELIAKHFKKGDEIYIEGNLANSVAKKENVEFTTTSIIVSNVKFTHGNNGPKAKELTDEDFNVL